MNEKQKEMLRKLASLAGLILLIIAFTISNEYFFTLNNVLTIGLQTSTIALIGIGATIVILTGGIDLSTGSVVALSGRGGSDVGQRWITGAVRYAIWHYRWWAMRFRQRLHCYLDALTALYCNIGNHDGGARIGVVCYKCGTGFWHAGILLLPR